MGTSASGQLVYGYNLGGGDSGWEVREVDEEGGLTLEWWSDPDTYDDDDVFVEVAEKRLLEAVGFTETDWRIEGYHDRQDEAKARLGVEFESYCSGDYPEYILAAKVIRVSQGHTRVVDFAALTAEAIEQRWDEKLAAALTTLGMTPKQEKPGWLLCSYLG